MDLSSMLNSSGDAPPRRSAPPTPQAQDGYHPGPPAQFQPPPMLGPGPRSQQQLRMPPQQYANQPPPLQVPSPMQSPYQQSPASAYSAGPHPQSASQSPYRPSPASATQYPFPSPAGPGSSPQNAQSYQQQGYPPTSAGYPTPSPQNRPPLPVGGPPANYPPQQSQPYQSPQDAYPPQYAAAPHPGPYSQIHRQQPPQSTESPRYGPSPMASPREQPHSLMVHANSVPNSRPQPPLPAVSTPLRERDRRMSDRDISISPKTKLPYTDEEEGPKGEREPGGEPTVSPHKDSYGRYHTHSPPRSISHTQPSPSHGGFEERGSSMPPIKASNASSNDTMETDAAGNERKWSTPSAPPSRGTNGTHDRSLMSSSPPRDLHASGQQGTMQGTSASPSAARDEQGFQMPQRPGSVSHGRLPPSPGMNKALHPPPSQQAGGSHGPPRKRTRYDEPPIFARKASKSVKTGGPTNPPPAPAHPIAAAQPNSTQHIAPQQQQQHHQQSHTAPPGQVQVKQETRTDRPEHEVQVPSHPLGMWEPTIRNTTPREDLTQTVCNFLFNNVVQFNDPAISWDGNGPVIEIEAKLGHIIDPSTRERWRLPVTTECCITEDARLSFKSSMTESQHRQLNEFLNKSFQDSQPHSNTRPGESPRIPMKYVHTRERDAFHQLPQSEYQLIPPTLRDTFLGARFKPSVRVTTDNKTGRVLNRIVKTRVADLHIYCPSSAFDCRISVNIELPWTGETGPPERNNRGDRNKDRMSYRHLCFQVDLTQVSDQSAKKEHELEVEINALELRRQGLWAKEGKPNGYFELVKGFIDNVRLLNRVIDPREGWQ